MKVYYRLTDVGKIQNPVVTTGIFDGVHIGHKAIIERLKKYANVIHGQTVIITFFPHPRKVLYPKTKGKNLKCIYSQSEKIKLLSEIGIDHLIIIPFTREFAVTTSEQFVKNILVNKLKVKKIIVGFNHHFGYLKTGNYAILKEMGKEYGFEVEEIPAMELENETISSTRIRNALKEGNIQRANAYLDHFYSISGDIKPADKKFERIGFPMYRLIPDENSKLIPPSGIYAVSAKIEKMHLRGMVKIEKHKKSIKTIEVHFFNIEKENFTVQTVSVNIHKRIRKYFVANSIEKIKSQLTSDKNRIEELIF